MRRGIISILIVAFFLTLAPISIGSLRSTTVSQLQPRLHATLCNGWNIETVDSDGNVGRGTSLALDSNGYPHISYFDRTNKALKYAYWTGTNWSIETLDSPVASFSSLALDSNDTPHIAYMYRISYPAEFCLKYAVWTEQNWEKVTIDDSNNTAGWHVHLILDSNDIPHMSYAVGDSPGLYYSGNIIHAWQDDTGWNTETIDTDCFCQNSIANDSNDTIAVVYDKFILGSVKAKLKYAKQKTTSGWEISDVHSHISKGPGGSKSLIFDLNNQPHISYSEFYYEGGTANYDKLMYAHLDGEGWNITTVDDTDGRTGFFNSLALDSNNNPHISYSYGNDDTPDFGALKYAYKYSKLPWKTETITSREENQYGGYNSLVLDSNDNPNISFYNGYTTGGLMYTYTSTNHPPNPPIITGETSGNAGNEYEYTFNATDPEGDNVYYWIEWFEGDPSAKWEGPYSSDEEITRNHTWSKEGTYMIKAKAKDTYGAEGPWGYLEVTMPKNKIYINYINEQQILKILERFTIHHFQLCSSFPISSL